MDDEIKAYSIIHEAMMLLDWEEYYPKIRLEQMYIEDLSGDSNIALCSIVRTILLDSVPELYQMLK